MSHPPTGWERLDRIDAGAAGGRLKDGGANSSIACRGAGSQAKGGPKARSPIPGTVTRVPKVARDDPGPVTPPVGQCDGSAPVSRIAEAWG